LKKYVFPALFDNCPAFKEDWEKQQKGELDSDTLFLWQALFVNSGNNDMAIEFTKATPKRARADLKRLKKFIAEAKGKTEAAEGKKCKSTKCSTLGCPTEQIKECHKKLLKNASGEPSNSPAYHIREANLEKYKAREEFNAIKDEVFEKLAAGDTSAHLDDTFLDLVAALKSKDSLAYNKLLDELSGMKVKSAAFKEEINKRSKVRSKEKIAAEAQELKMDLPDCLKPYAEGVDPSTSFVDENGYIIAVVKTSEGSYRVQASNFVARIKEVLAFDDDIEIVQQFVIDGILEGVKKLPTITVKARDFRSMNWVERYWGNLLITSVPKARDIVRETIQRVSNNAPTTKVHYTLGWKNIGKDWCYLYSGGSIGGNNILVADINELKGYFFKKYSYSVEKCAKYVQKFMEIASHEITIPLLAHAFLSILIERLKQEEIEPRYLMWVYGVSGSFKTALTVVLMSFFGTFNSPPATFNDTAAALEKKAYLTKDSLLLVDDFHPSASPQEAKSKASIANGLTRKYGDRITRSRSKSNLTLAKDYPPRGNLICTSEDLLIGYSTNSRHMGIEIHRGDIDPNILTKLQNNKKYFACFMVNFIQYVAEKIMSDPAVTYKEKFLDYRNKSQNHNHHKRFAEAIACLQIGWETFLDFLKHIKYIDKAEYKKYFDEGFTIFQNLAKRQNDLVQNDDIADKFMMALKELLDTKQIVPIDKDAPSTLHKGASICYHDEGNYYFIPQSTYAMVANFFLKRGDLLNVNDYMLRKMLADHKYTVESSDGDGHMTRKVKIGILSTRVLQIPKAVLNTF
jgi:hypothetical protein